ncbi:MAG: hypothetical protein ABW161_06630 [Candidatus Thiodiazotropha sp.]
MDDLLSKPEQLAQLCAEADASAGLDALKDRLAQLMPDMDFNCALTRGGWHRLGGVVDAEYQPISDNIAHWAERESGGDVDELIARYTDQGYFATQLAGKTHFFTAPFGDKAEDFIQLEVEELQEALERPLVERDWFPDSLEEFLDPLDYPRLEPEPVGEPYYQFRRITSIAKLLHEAPRENQSLSSLRRFFQDWEQSSANEGGPFCNYWVMALREYMGSDGECRHTARPVFTYPDKLPDLPPGESLHGVKLANAVHDYDRQLGCPFAWYFIMLSSKAANYSLAEAVLRDQMGAYDYLPARDLKVLRQWGERPYGV